MRLTEAGGRLCAIESASLKFVSACTADVIFRTPADLSQRSTAVHSTDQRVVLTLTVDYACHNRDGGAVDCCRSFIHGVFQVVHIVDLTFLVWRVVEDRVQVQ